MRVCTILPRFAWASKIQLISFHIFWPNQGPGRLPLESGSGDIEVAAVFALVASSSASFVSEFIFESVVETILKYAQAKPRVLPEQQ